LGASIKPIAVRITWDNLMGLLGRKRATEGIISQLATKGS
jgi:hypothetical protein